MTSSATRPGHLRPDHRAGQAAGTWGDLGGPFATRLPPAGGAGGQPPPPQVHIIVTGGMPGWQIALIAIGAALVAAALAVLLDRAWASRRQTVQGT